MYLNEDFNKDENWFEELNKEVFDGMLGYEDKNKFPKNFPNCLPNNDREKLNEIALILGNSNDNPLVQKVNNIRDRRILFIGSENLKHSYLNISQELKEIKQEIKNKSISIENVFPNWTNIINKWDTYNPNVIFFSCHGTEHTLLLKDEEGLDNAISAVDLKIFLDRRSNYTECVILSACESLTIGKTILSSCNNVIAINKKVSINTARIFTNAFVRYLSENPHSLNDVYNKAFQHCRDLVTLNGFDDAFSFEFLTSKKVQ
jgi:hypothetical protein